MTRMKMFYKSMHNSTDSILPWPTKVLGATPLGMAGTAAVEPGAKTRGESKHE